VRAQFLQRLQRRVVIAAFEPMEGVHAEPLRHLLLRYLGLLLEASQRLGESLGKVHEKDDCGRALSLMK
jgi:hypothetical protein